MKTIPLLLSACLMSFTMVGCTSLQTTHSSSTTMATTEPVIAYFAPDAGEEACDCGLIMDQGYSLTPVENGYFRKLLGRDKDGRFLVQDFYQNSRKKQSDPFWIKAPQGLNSFDSKYVDGEVVGYFENGKISFKSTSQDQRLVGKTETYYSNGQLGLQEEYSDDQPIVQKVWYEDGKPAAELKLSPSEDYSILDSKVWDQQGNLIQDEQRAQEILDELYQKLNQ